MTIQHYGWSKVGRRKIVGWFLAGVMVIQILCPGIAVGEDHFARVLPVTVQKMLKQYFEALNQGDYRTIYRDMSTSSFKVAGSFDRYQEKMAAVVAQYGKAQTTDMESMFILSSFTADAEGRTFERLLVTVLAQHEKGSLEHRFSFINLKPLERWELSDYVLYSDEVKGPLFHQGDGHSLIVYERPKPEPDYPWNEPLSTGSGLYPAQPQKNFPVDYDRAMGIAVEVLQNNGFEIFSLDKYQGDIGSHQSQEEPGQVSCGVNISLRRTSQGEVQVRVSNLCGSCELQKPSVFSVGPASGNLPVANPGSFNEYIQNNPPGSGTACMDYVDPSLNQKIMDSISQAIEKDRRT